MFGVGLAKQPDIPVSGGTSGFVHCQPNEVEVGEVLDTEHAGEDRTGGKRTNGTFNNDMASEMDMSAEKRVTQIPFHLEPMRCAHIGKVQR